MPSITIRRRAALWLTPLLAAILAVGCGLLIITASGGDNTASAAPAPCDPSVPGPSPSQPPSGPGAGGGGTFAGIHLTATQIGNASTIVGVGKFHQVPAQGLIVALAAAMQESHLINLDHGDRDSLGLFQQRPSQGWGTPADLQTPPYAAGAFYGGPGKPTDDHDSGLLDIPNWQNLPIGQAAQAVQHSAYPDAYTQWVAMATALSRTVHGGVPPACAPTGPGSLPSGPVGKIIAFATAQLGKPYLWGGAGPGAFDCSGLTMRAWQAGGVLLPRTSRDQYTAGTHIPLSQIQPGDLLFWGYNKTDPATIHHVALYIGIRHGEKEIIEAPTEGIPVRYNHIYDTSGSQLIPTAVRVSLPNQPA